MDDLSSSPNYPEEYLRGSVVFFGREFLVTPDVLIPRLETEALVRRARNILSTEHIDCVIDVGTGSGIIVTSLADLGDTVFFALDISHTALQIAKKNFLKYHTDARCTFLHTDMLDGFRDVLLGEREKMSVPIDALFLANLPYIKNDDWEHMSPDTRFEPSIALFGGDKTGFELYERLFSELLREAHSGVYHRIKLMMEFGFDQRKTAEAVLKNSGWEYTFFSDYSGRERFVEVDILLL